MNRILATPVKGIYKGKEVEVIFGLSSGDTVIKVNGKKIEGVQYIGISCRVGQTTQLCMELIEIPKLKKTSSKKEECQKKKKN